MDIKKILETVKAGELDIQSAATQLQGFEDLGHSRVDTIRAERNGADEVIFGQGKTTEHIVEIIGSLDARKQNILVTRIDPDVADIIVKSYPSAEYSSLARILTITNVQREKVKTKIAVICAGTSDLPVAEEARLTAEFYGNPVEQVYDAGVAGLHRLLASIDTINSCKVVIVVAGMEGALPSVVGGLVKAPVIAVPTSVGYGANFGGLSALLGMLNSCASGVTVVNIDNGFGAGYSANRMNRL
ncbi:MAG: nickel pincer cofactor biosynthesis protein LarB [Lentimonas sp.]